MRTIFSKTLDYIQYNQDLLFHRVGDDEKVTEESFLNHLATKTTIDGTPVYPTVELARKFCKLNDENMLIPKQSRYVFLKFNPIEEGVDTLAYKSLILHRKLFRHVIRRITKFINVCDIEGKDTLYDVARQFYTIDDKLNLSIYGYQGQTTLASTHLYLSSVIKSNTGSIERFKCKSNRTKLHYTIKKDDELLNKIGLIASHPRAIPLPSKWTKLKRHHRENSKEHSALVVLYTERYYCVMDTVLCNVISAFENRSEVRKFCRRLIKLGFELTYYSSDRQRLGASITNILTGVASTPSYLERLLRFVASKWSPGMRDRMFRNKALVGFISPETGFVTDESWDNSAHNYENVKRDAELKNVSCLDFNKFYPRILVLLGCKRNLCKTMKTMLALQRVSPSVKMDMVSTIGKLIFYDARLHHAIKSCAVAIMYDLMDRNPALTVVGCATDSIFVRGFNGDLESLTLSRDFFDLDTTSTIPLKIENSFDNVLFMGSINKYIGFLSDGEVTIRGYSCPRTKPLAECKLINAVAKTLLENNPVDGVSSLWFSRFMFDTVKKTLESVMIKDLIFPTRREEETKNDLKHPVVYFQSNLCQDRHMILHDAQKTLKVVGYDEYAVLPKTSCWYTAHMDGSANCCCTNCTAKRVVNNIGKKIHVGCCFCPDYHQYAKTWNDVVETLINDIFKYRQSYDKLSTENKKSLHFRLISGIRDELFRWADKCKANIGFVAFGGMLQSH